MSDLKKIEASLEQLRLGLPFVMASGNAELIEKSRSEIASLESAMMSEYLKTGNVGFLNPVDHDYVCNTASEQYLRSLASGGA